MISALVVDDESPARSKLCALLARVPGIEVIGEAEDGETALDAIRSLNIDVVFLDIQMPRLDGFGVIERIGIENMPLVVFVTAFDEHALRAFEVHAFDYLLKPFAADRLRCTVERVLRRLSEGRKSSRQLGQVVEAASEGLLTRLLVESSTHREKLLAISKIDIFRAQRNYVEMISEGHSFRKRGTLSSLEARLDPDSFLRVNRSEIVRLDAVAEVQPWFHGDYRVILHDGQMLSWSRRYRSRDRKRFETAG